VHFVGAGPGAADLITIRGRDLIARADLIIYAGSLVNPALLDGAREGSERLNSAAMTLEEIIEAIAEAAGRGWRVVRLHSGDPSLYGAIHEQMRALDRRGIGYEICPGVSALGGAAAALGIEYTVPEITQTLVITRMPGRTPMPKAERVAQLASHGSSLAVFLSAGLLAELQDELLAAGRPASAAAAIVHRATWPDQQVLRCTVGELAATARKHGVKATALIVVGPCLTSSDTESRLYAPDFATGGEGRIAAISFTAAGAALGRRLADRVAGVEAIRCPEGGLAAWTAARVGAADAL
jgi:precorrin-4/cobalt-precorrin-4 C11-methyltransferase